MSKAYFVVLSALALRGSAYSITIVNPEGVTVCNSTCAAFCRVFNETDEDSFETEYRPYSNTIRRHSSDHCFFKCDGRNCYGSCQSFDPETPCTMECEGGQCKTSCKGPWCTALCEGEGCISECEGANCSAVALIESNDIFEEAIETFHVKCTGSGCTAECAGLNCNVTCISSGAPCNATCLEDEGTCNINTYQMRSNYGVNIDVL